MQAIATTCPVCANELAPDPAYHGLCSCPVCRSTLSADGQSFRAVQCPRCHTAVTSLPSDKMTGTAKALLIVGICLIPVFFTGLILIFAGSCMKSSKFHCARCNHWF